MKEIIRKALLECPRGSSLEGYTDLIEARLKEAGFGKLDPYLLGFLDQLRHGLKDTSESLGRIIESVSLLSLSKDKCETILRLIEEPKEKQAGGKT